MKVVDGLWIVAGAAIGAIIGARMATRRDGRGDADA